MIPKIDFGFLICTYLPGLPITIALYVTFLNSVISKNGSNTSTIFFIVAPLIFGLFLDAIRHGLGRFQVIGRFRIKCMHNKFGWQLLPQRKLQERYPCKYQEVFLSNIIAIIETNYHVYEFFGNFFLSCLFALCFFGLNLFIFKNAIKGEIVIIIILSVLSGLSLYGAWVFASEQKERVDYYF